jgi:hypothetical protein
VAEELEKKAQKIAIKNYLLLAGTPVIGLHKNIQQNKK